MTEYLTKQDAASSANRSFSAYREGGRLQLHRSAKGAGMLQACRGDRSVCCMPPKGAWWRQRQRPQLYHRALHFYPSTHCSAGRRFLALGRQVWSLSCRQRAWQVNVAVSKEPAPRECMGSSRSCLASSLNPLLANCSQCPYSLGGCYKVPINCSAADSLHQRIRCALCA